MGTTTELINPDDMASREALETVAAGDRLFCESETADPDTGRTPLNPLTAGLLFGGLVRRLLS
jgi:hypothetical protein